VSGPSRGRAVPLRSGLFRPANPARRDGRSAPQRVGADRRAAGQRARREGVAVIAVKHQDRAREAAGRLVRELERYGVPAVVHAGHRLAAVSVWVDLMVWTEGAYYWWSSGRPSAGRHGVVYLHCPVERVEAAAQRITGLFGQGRYAPVT